MKVLSIGNSFIWLKDAGIAHPTFCADESRVPLLLSKATNLFKLFLSDVGLLAAMYMEDIQIKILNREKDINFGSIYENVAAQELKAHGFELYYFNSKKQGEFISSCEPAKQRHTVGLRGIEKSFLCVQNGLKIVLFKSIPQE